jgi:hypothetical protein
VGTIGALSGGGVNIAVPRQGSAPYAATGLRVGFELPIVSAFALRAQADAALALARPKIQIDGSDVFSVSPVVGAASLLGVARF